MFDLIYCFAVGRSGYCVFVGDSTAVVSCLAHYLCSSGWDFAALYLVPDVLLLCGVVGVVCSSLVQFVCSVSLFFNISFVPVS